MSENVLFWGWGEADQVDAIEAIKEQSKHEVKLWVGDHNHGTYNYRELFEKQTCIDNFKCTPPDNKLNNKELLMFLELFGRENRSNGEDFYEHRNIANLYYCKLSMMLHEEKISKALFSLVPCTGFDYLAYVVCKSLNIDVIICRQQQEDMFFGVRNVEDWGVFESVNAKRKITNFPINYGFEKKLWYVKDAKEVPSQNVSPLIRFIKESFRYRLRNGSKPMSSAGVIKNYKQAKLFRKYYNKYSVKVTEGNLPEKFVYFPLHLQPELTTSTLGGRYADQLKAIEAVSRMIPYDWKIIVKEYPKQGFLHRGINFFNRLFALDKVIYASMDSNTYMLLRKSNFTATITGTIGWESITGLKPVLVFGYAWYRTLPGVTYYHDKLKVEEIVGNHVDPQELQSKYNEIMSKTFLGVMDSRFNKLYGNYSKIQNIERLSIFIEDFCNDKI